MEKIDYKDINRFFTSVGLISIILSVIAPFLLFNESLNLLINIKEISGCYFSINDFINNQIQYVRTYFVIIKYMIPFLFLLGVSSLVYGIVRWNKRQMVDDKKSDIELIKIQQDIATNEEVKNKIKNKIELFSKEALKKTHTKDNGIINKIMTIEKEIEDVFCNYKTSLFSVYPRQKISKDLIADILLVSNDKHYSDRIVEYKYLKESFDENMVERMISTLQKEIVLYIKSIHRDVVPVLLFIYDSFLDDEIQRMKLLIADKILKEELSMQRLNMDFIQEKNIQNYDVRRVLLG